ncbi:MAG: efflux RND transporter periplasmic adaptor subunit [Candidatus Aminicenantes bacterium]|jgi:cobalt-zinc-cadmium efflux system membrane fusion protein
MMNKNKIWIFSLFLSAVIVITPLIFTQCSSGNEGKPHPSEAVKDNRTHDQEDHEHDEEKERSLVQLNDKELKEFGIQVATVGQATIQEHIDLTGEIITDPNRLAHMKPRFSGIVKEIRKAIGDRVKKGEVLAIIESNESLVKYKLTSAINGTVIDMHMTLGENLDDDSHNVTVADLTTVWANFSIYQKDLFDVKVGQPVLITAIGETFERSGRISYISPVVDRRTRTASARVVLNNKDGKWKPGMFVTAKVLTIEKKVPLAVSKTALLLFEGQNVVFVQERDGFRPQPVTIGIQNSQSVEIISGLFEGQKYIAKGAFMVKAELQKESFGSGHHH